MFTQVQSPPFPSSSFQFQSASLSTNHHPQTTRMIRVPVSDTHLPVCFPSCIIPTSFFISTSSGSITTTQGTTATTSEQNNAELRQQCKCNNSFPFSPLHGNCFSTTYFDPQLKLVDIHFAFLANCDSRRLASETNRRQILHLTSPPYYSTA